MLRVMLALLALACKPVCCASMYLKGNLYGWVIGSSREKIDSPLIHADFLPFLFLTSVRSFGFVLDQVLNLSEHLIS